MPKISSMENRPSIAIFICSRTVGGHEFQVATIVRDLSFLANITVYVNDANFKKLFSEKNINIIELNDKLLRRGKLPVHFWSGLMLRRLFYRSRISYDFIIVSAGSVEASLTVGLAFFKRSPIYLYLPFFFDRAPIWGSFIGNIYNFFLIQVCKIFDLILTINRIQSHVITSMTSVQTLVIPNLIREVAAPIISRRGKLVFIGRLDAQKRIDELLDWINFEGNPFDEILIIGDGPLMRELKVFAKGIHHIKVIFLGWLSAEEQDKLLVCNDLLIINSLLEGEPLVIREAKKRGMGVLARDIVGVRGITSPSVRYKSREDLHAKLKSRNPEKIYNGLTRLRTNERLELRKSTLKKLLSGNFRLK